MTVLVTGANGQLGLDVLDAYADRDVVGLSHTELDISSEADVLAAVRDHDAHLVVNCAAWTDVDGCEQDPDRAHLVNAVGPWWVARACRLSDAAMVHISTDYVFAGEGRIGGDGEQMPYSEFDPIDPLNEYGRAKAAGEALIRGELDAHYIVRTAWVCGARGSNFVRTMLRVGRERGEARVVDDQVGSPTFTRDLAAAIRELAATGRFGTYNRTNAGTCSWFDLAAATYELAGVAVDLQPMSSHELDRPAARPAYSVLSERHARAVGLSPLPPWREGLRRLLEELEAA